MRARRRTGKTDRVLISKVLNEKNQYIEILEKEIKNRDTLIENASKILLETIDSKSKSHIVDHALAVSYKFKKLQQKLDSITFKDIIKYANNKKEENHGQKLLNPKTKETMER